MTSAPVICRFAPSPTGYLHCGHAYSALMAFNYAKEHDGQFILRIEDIDPTRCKPEFTKALFEDLHWLGLTWEEPVRIQSQHYDDYAQALRKLKDIDLLYPCFCTRKDIQDEISQSGQAAHGPEGPVYPGLCKHLPQKEQSDRIAAGEGHAWRLDLNKALDLLQKTDISWQEGKGTIRRDPHLLGDVVLARKDIGTSYHLSVVVDDALQRVTHIIRGEDLEHATPIQRVLQDLLGYAPPTYSHHKLLTDHNGIRLAKRNQALSLHALREREKTPQDIFEMISLRPITF